MDKQITSTDKQRETRRLSAELLPKDPVRRKSLELKRQELDDELKSKQENLDRVNSLYRDWKKLRVKLSKNNKHLKETLKYIIQTKEVQDALGRENIKIGKILN